MCPAAVPGGRNLLTMAKWDSDGSTRSVLRTRPTQDFCEAVASVTTSPGAWCQQEKLLDRGTAQGSCKRCHKCPPRTEPVSARTRLWLCLRNPRFSSLKHSCYVKFFLSSFLPQEQPSWYCVCDWQHCSWKDLAGVIEGLISRSYVGTGTRETAGWTPCPAALIL